MKNQDTVEKNFAQTVTAWEASRTKKIQNVEKAMQDLQKKYQKIYSEYKRLEAERERLQKLEPPKAPSVQERSSQRQASLKRLELQ